MKFAIAASAVLLNLFVPTSPANADIIQIDDSTDILTVSLTHDRPLQEGTISDLIFSGTETVSFTYTLAPGERWLASLMLFRRMLDPVTHTVSDVFRIETFENTRTALIEFASAPDTLDLTGFTRLPGITENGDWQTLFQAGGIDPWKLQARSSILEPPSLALVVISLLGVGALRRRGSLTRPVGTPVGNSTVSLWEPALRYVDA